MIIQGKVFLREEVLKGEIYLGKRFLEIWTDDGRRLMVPISAVDYIEVERNPLRQEQPQAL